MNSRKDVESLTTLSLPEAGTRSDYPRELLGLIDGHG